MSDRESNEHDTDRELLAAWVRGEEEAGQELVARYFVVVRRYFVRRTPRDDHEDQVQKTFVKLQESMSQFRGGSVRAFIFGIARNTLLHYIRDEKKHRNFDPLDTSVHAAFGGGLSSILVQQEHHRILLDALQAVPSADQDLLELYYWQDMPGPELAVVFEIAENTVHTRLFRARARLLEAFSKISGQPQQPAEQDLVTWLRETGRMQ